MKNDYSDLHIGCKYNCEGFCSKYCHEVCDINFRCDYFERKEVVNCVKNGNQDITQAKN